MTVNEYIAWSEKYRSRLIESGYFRSKPEPLFIRDHFDDYYPAYLEFNPDNWNGGDILRKWLVEVWTPDLQLKDYQIKYYWVDDQTTIYILGENEWFEISWYKNRGRTESIKLNGRYIDLDDYVRLCTYIGITLED